ncbi:hypothetical protein IW249_006391 [Micromonospora vinacea]|uniref:Uncharacterized protein n=1 Tax=Micromonospora vinacea TaxID=709878 RepID=A0ABS0KBH1_9ACTN|nr:hypothetical protein [Micromonospora vinacea]MBG6105977.1 hypothetical protein [Micromonospora vinacea]
MLVAVVVCAVIVAVRFGWLFTSPGVSTAGHSSANAGWAGDREW